jgi:hypothetical protein
MEYGCRAWPKKSSLLSNDNWTIGKAIPQDSDKSKPQTTINTCFTNIFSKSMLLT